MRKRTRKRNVKIIVAAAVVVIAAAISAFIPENIWNEIFIKTGLREPQYVSAPVSVHFIDVGQGDCALITTDRGENVLVDSGEEIKADIVIQYLKNLSVEKLDYCIVSHPHSDHYGGMLKILKEIPAENAVMPVLGAKNTPEDSYYSKFVSYINKNCKTVKYLKAGDSFSLEKVKFDVFAPAEQRTELNEMSLVIKASYGNASVMLAGDCSADEENDILRMYGAKSLKCNILKVGHHGGAEASSDGWLDTLKPDVCVVSAGKYNSYGLPSAETLERFEKRNIKYYRTDICGTVVFDCNDKEITLR